MLENFIEVVLKIFCKIVIKLRPLKQITFSYFIYIIEYFYELQFYIVLYPTFAISNLWLSYTNDTQLVRKSKNLPNESEKLNYIAITKHNTVTILRKTSDFFLYRAQLSASFFPWYIILYKFPYCVNSRNENY